MLFGASYDVLLYDLTSTYFETDPPLPRSDKRKFGYSRDKRADCVQVVIALVVTPEGFPLAYEVLAGNTRRQDHAGGFLEKDRRALRQGLAHLADGPRHSDRRGAGADARERSAGLLPGGHAQGAAVALRGSSWRGCPGNRRAKAWRSNCCPKTANSMCWRGAATAWPRSARCAGASSRRCGSG